jgi:hypothetical protein
VVSPLWRPFFSTRIYLKNSDVMLKLNYNSFDDDGVALVDGTV